MRALLLALLVLASTAAAQDFRALVEPGQPTTFHAEGVFATLEAQGPENLTWRLQTSRTALDGIVELRGWFDVPSPRQVVPETRSNGTPDADWHLFIEVDAATISDRPEGARNLNRTGDARNITLRLAFPVNATSGEAWLRLRRDMRAPGFSVGAVENLTPFAFFVETTTDEPALATLNIRPAAGGEAVPFPTTFASRLQRFPVQGLAADRDYLFNVTFQDWAGNTATSPDVPVHTPARPVLPAPRITGRVPEANATVPAPVSLLAVTYEGPAPAAARDVQVFVDKSPQTAEDLTLAPGKVEVRVAPPLGPGRHSVAFELTSAEGGTAVERWSFTVAGATPFPPASAAGALALAALVAARGKRRA